MRQESIGTRDSAPDRMLGLVIMIVLLVVAFAVGVGVGHALWGTH